MNPYEADPSKIPASDLYADLPFYGRYLPRASDFVPDPQRKNSASYWESMLEKCDSSNCLYESIDGGRDVFALGSVIIKSSHRRSDAPKRHYALADANEVAVLELVRETMSKADVQVPTIHYAGKIQDRDVLVQSRIPGVALNVAWPYLSSDQKAMFKGQARELLRLWQHVQPTTTTPSYIVPDDNPVSHRNITRLEQDILFHDEPDEGARDVSLVHNDLNESNIIVDSDKIVGVVDWEMAGWFGRKRAGAVHSRCRVPKLEDFANLDLSDERLADLTYWNDLYL